MFSFDCFRRSASTVLLTTLIAIAGFVSNSEAGLVDIDSTQVGGFYETGTPDNAAVFQNYFVGHGTVGEFTTPERRSFFIFDIPMIAPGSLVAADFSIYLPTSFSLPANFTGGEEVFEITSTIYPSSAILDPMGEMVATGDIFSSFGTGDFYGDLPFFSASPPTGPFPLELIIPLSPAAIADIEAASGGTFVISGRMATYDPAPMALDEIIFSLSDLVTGGVETPLPKPFLTLSTVPEPTTLLTFGVLLGIMGLPRKRTR